MALPGGDFLPGRKGGGNRGALRREGCEALSSIALFSMRVAVLSIPGVTWSSRLLAWLGLLCQEFSLSASGKLGKRLEWY